MDDEDSQDELINRSTSQCKGKRAAVWAISDDSDDVEEVSDEGESNSGEDDEEDGEEEEEEEEEEENEEDGEDEEEDEKAEERAFGGTSADLAGVSSDEDIDKCPICLNSFSSQPVATPENCEHYFCLDCILEWAKNANSCPVDRITFNSIYLRICYGGKVKKMITVQKPVKEGQEERVDLDLEQTNCEVCGASDREDRLLLCDGCDAGYHMECLTPPLDSVPVEEWFCPECEANNRHSRDSFEELSDIENLPSTARPATRRAQSAGPTRAIARTQQSERVRANVNRHRITQARSSQLAPTYLIESSWLDETINAVVAGLNTSVYIRDFTPRMTGSRRSRTKKRRMVKRKKTTSAVGKKGKTAGAGTRGKKRKARRTKSRRKLVVKKVTTPRGRIADHLGIVKDKKGSSLPTVYRPSEYTLSGMRADIGAASLSIYGDPFDLDPFVDHEEEEQQAQVPSLLEAKRRGISQSALRSHQPVARPVTASLSRRAVDVHQPGGVVESPPVPDLLGSILSGQSMLLMDSSDVIINRDGSLKATKPVMQSALQPSVSRASSLGDAGTQVTPVMSPNQGDGFPSPHQNEGSSHCSTNRPLPQNSSHMPSSASPFVSSPQVHPRLQPPCPMRPTFPPGHRGASGLPSPSLSPHLHHESNSKNKGMTSHSQSKKAAAKPMWVDVSVLPRIPKIKRDTGGITNDVAHRSSSSGPNSSNSAINSHDYGMPETGINSFAGDKGRQQSLDQHKGRTDGQTQRPRPGAVGSSSAFSNSFSSSSSGSPASRQHHSSSSSSSSAAVSFRINSSGNSWHSRRLNIGPSPCSSSSVQELGKQKEEEARKRQLHRDKQMLLASRTLGGSREKDSNNIYDPFNPTLSESGSSDEEAESTSLGGSSQRTTQDEETPSSEKEEHEVQSKEDPFHVENKLRKIKISEEEPRRAGAQEALSQVSSPQKHAKVEKGSRLEDSGFGKQTLCDIKVKTESGTQGAKERKAFSENVKSFDSETRETKPNVHQSRVKTEKKTQGEENESHESPNMASSNSKNYSTASSLVPNKKKQKTDTKPDSKCSSKSPSKNLHQAQEVIQVSKEHRSGSSETDRSRRGEHHTSDDGHQQKETKDEKQNSRQLVSRHRKRERSSSESSHSDSSDKGHRKKRRFRSRSRSKERRRSRSGSSSSSREQSRRNKHNERSKERRDGRERDSERKRVPRDKRRGHSRSKSHSKSRSRSTSRSKDCRRGRSVSRSRSRSGERIKDQTRVQQSSVPSRHKGDSKSKNKRRHRSRSSSRERRREEKSSKNSQKSAGPSVDVSKDTEESQTKKKDKEIVQRSLKDEKVATARKQETSVHLTHLKENKKDRRDSRASTADMVKVKKVVKEIKKEKEACLDMFDDSAVSKPIKKEDPGVHALEVNKESSEEGSKDKPIKTEPWEISDLKSEPSSSEICQFPSASTFPPLAAPVNSQDAASQLASAASAEQTRANVKEELLQPSDSEDDFNVDVMLDNLDYESKSEHTEPSAVSIKQDKEAEEGAVEGGQVTAVVGVKSKNQVKRVTWNIQEPEGPQPEKSSSKLALYKLKLKQEGARRPVSLAQTSSQDVTGPVSDTSTRGAADLLCSSSRSDGVHHEGLSTSRQGEANEGDMSRKDKYLKKLHMQERAIEEVKLAIKPFYQKRDINKDEYKEILRKAVQKVCHSKSGEINPVKVGNLVKAYVDKYKHARKHKKGDDSGKTRDGRCEAIRTSDSP